MAESSLMGCMMIEGMWILKILPPPVTSGGVVVFMNGKILGGDNGFTWVGSYSISDTMIKGRVHVHNFDPDIQSVLGVPGDYEMHFSGTLESENLITGTAMIANQPQHSLALSISKYAAL
jgi:hypothetical protein